MCRLSDTLKREQRTQRLGFGGGHEYKATTMAGQHGSARAKLPFAAERMIERQVTFAAPNAPALTSGWFVGGPVILILELGCQRLFSTP